MRDVYDLVAIGTGPAGSTIATHCARQGWRVAIAESRDFGGTCALRGCNPKKVFVNAAELVDRVRRGEDRLVRNGRHVDIDWSALIRFSHEFTAPVPQRSEHRFRASGIETLHGTARFTGRNEVRVGERDVRGEHVVIATGARPAPLDVPGAEHLTMSDEFMELSTLPRRVCFIGGGYISFEFGHVAARAGAEATIVDRHLRPLRRFEPRLVDMLVDRSRRVGIEILTESELASIARDGNAFEVTLRGRGGAEDVRQADLVVHGAGRVPNLDGMDLEAADIAYGDAGITVDEHLRSVSNPQVFAAGDCAATPAAPLTPCANEHARVVAANLVGEGRHVPDHSVVPTVVFTVPGLAACGLTEDAARQRGASYRVREGDMSTWGSVRKVCEDTAAYKLLIDDETDRILGAHLLGPGAAEAINLFAVAMRAGMTAGDLESVLLAFPTFASDIRRML